jgi:P4 family phage/plasmid primase-like protien
MAKISDYENYAREEREKAAKTANGTTIVAPQREAVRKEHTNVTVLKPKSKLPVPILDDDLPHAKMGGVIIGLCNDTGRNILFTEKAAYQCDGNGLWSMSSDRLLRWLNVEIEKASKACNYKSTSKLVDETRKWIERQYILNRKHDDIRWDQHGMVPTRSGLVDPRTGVIRPIRPDDYCTWRIEAEFAPTAKCPWWLQMLEDVFADRDPKERAATISVIQEMLGAGLIDEKPREISKALVLLGGSNFGKSGLLEVLGGLFGQDFNTTPIEALESAHGKMGFIKRRPWVLHEAFDQRKWLFSSDVKTIITGEPININIKNGPILSQRVYSPIFWGTNHPPTFKESTKAITNRLVVIECKREFFPDKPVGAAAEAFRLGLGKPSNLVLRDEMAGLLAWAMAGLKRVLQRGHLVLTKSMSDTIEEIRKDSNMVAGFVEECCYHDPNRMVSTADFSLAFSSWWQQNRGETYSPPSNEVIGKNVVAMADPLIAVGRELRDNRCRYYGGLVLNAVGESYHAAGAASSHLEAKKANTTGYDGQVNKAIPAGWATKPEVIAMRRKSVTTT